MSAPTLLRGTNIPIPSPGRYEPKRHSGTRGQPSARNGHAGSEGCSKKRTGAARAHARGLRGASRSGRYCSERCKVRARLRQALEVTAAASGLSGDLGERVHWLPADQENPSPVLQVLIAQMCVSPSGSRGAIVGAGALGRIRRSVTGKGAAVKPGRRTKRCRWSALDRRSLSRFAASLGCATHSVSQSASASPVSGTAPPVRRAAAQWTGRCSLESSFRSGLRPLSRAGWPRR